MWSAQLIHSKPCRAMNNEMNKESETAGDRGALFRARRNPDPSPAYQYDSPVCQRNQSCLFISN